MYKASRHMHTQEAGASLLALPEDIFECIVARLSLEDLGHLCSAAKQLAEKQLAPGKSLRAHFKMARDAPRQAAKRLGVDHLASEILWPPHALKQSNYPLLAKLLTTSARLKMLYLDHNQIGDKGAAALGEALKVNKALNDLDVGNNKLSEKAAFGILRIESERNKLTHLGLAGCNISPSGATQIAELVKVNAVLTNLNLGHNEIGDVGATAIAEGLKVNAAPREPPPSPMP